MIKPANLRSKTYKVQLLPRGQIFSCSAEQTILQAALSANILFPHSCQGGQCGSCKSRLISGEYSYGGLSHDALSAEDIESGHLLCCRAKPGSDMTIELQSLSSSKRE